MGLMWLSVGILTGLSVWILYVLNKQYRIDWIAWTGLISGIFILLFGVAWSVSSILEGVPRSGSMGFLLFDGLGLIILLLTWRFNLQYKKKTGNEVSENGTAKNQEDPDSDIESNSRRKFLGTTVLGALNARHIIGGIIGLGAGVTGVVAVKRASGKVLDDVPNAIREDYKRFDQRGVIQAFAHSPKLQEEKKEWTDTWERLAKERGQTLWFR